MPLCDAGLFHGQKASDEAMYSSGYRQNIRDDGQYHARPNWEDREKPRNIEDARDASRKKFEMAREKLIEQDIKRPRSRSSRSPRRERSPIRDRLRRHSPSPRSPRRSWALEKRQSPESREPPPPPMWPGADSRDDFSHSRSKFHEPDIEKTSPIWLPREKREEYPTADRRRDYNDGRIKKDGPKWEPALPSHQDTSRFDEGRSLKESSFAKKDFDRRREINSREEEILRQRKLEKDYHRQDHGDSRYKADYERKVEVPRKKEEYGGRIEEKKKEILQKQEQLQKEIDEVYKRAVDFTKKAEMYKKGELKKDSNYDSDRRHKEDYESKDFDKHFKYDSFDLPGRDEGRKDSKYSSRNEATKKASDDKAMDLEDSHKMRVLSPTIKIKRHKAVEEIAEKMISKFGSKLPSEVLKRVESELRWTLGRKLYELFGEKDVSFIEMIIKFNAKHSLKDEEKIFEDILSGLPSQYRNLKRVSQDEYGVPPKNPRRSPEPSSFKDQPSNAQELQIPDWKTGALQSMTAPHPGFYMNAPVMVPLPAQYQFIQTYQEMPQNVVDNNRKDGYNLYLCKDDFTPIVEYETDKLKEFLVQQLIKVTETSQGWAPDFTLNKQHSLYRHEVITRDERSKDWLLNLDFSEFNEFGVLVYTTEELWYERAAVWLPGHSRCRNIEPLTKLKLQNKKLEGVNIGKWKLVKKIVMDKGTRVYVDMPPSSARALEKHKMMLSYELQKVNVFLKAVAIDKNAFDAGLNEPSIKVLPSPNNSPMPSLGQDPHIVKIAAKGNKPLPLQIARKVKDLIIYKLFKHHQLQGRSRTDFVKYGFCQPGFLGILPENEESRKWLCSLDLGAANRNPVIIVGADEDKIKYFKMKIMVPRDFNINVAYVFERLRQSNRGVKGLNFNLWKDQKISLHSKVTFEVQMDMESVETLSKMNYQLDYVSDGHDIKSVTVESEYSLTKLENIIAKYKAEMSDIYDVSNMDLESESESESSSQVICLD